MYLLIEENNRDIHESFESLFHMTQLVSASHVLAILGQSLSYAGGKKGLYAEFTVQNGQRAEVRSRVCGLNVWVISKLTARLRRCSRLFVHLRFGLQI